MNDHKSRNHVIDSLFPIVLFCLFTLSALVVILLAVKIYETTTERSARSNISQAALNYVSEKIRQNDCGSEFTITELDGQIALQIIHTGDKEGYVTYIYHNKEGLYELFIRDDIPPTLSAGSFIAKVTDFLPEFLDDNLLRLTLTDEQDNFVSTLVGIHSDTER